MNVSKTWILVIGIVAGAVFLGDDGGNVIRDIVSSIRSGAAGMFDVGGGGLRDFGGSIQ